MSESNRAKKLLFKVPELFEQGLLLTKPAVCKHVLNARSRAQSAGALQQAKKILPTTWENFESGKLDVKPDCVSHNCVIDSWAKSRQQGAANRAETAVGEMRGCCEAGDEVLKPGVISCSSVISARAKTGKAEKAEALQDEICFDFVSGDESAEPNV